MESENLEEELKKFKTSKKYFNHASGFVYSEGVSYLVEKTNAEWILNTIFELAAKKEFAKLDLQEWTLSLNEKGETILTMRKKADKPVLASKWWLYTDFPFEKFKEKKAIFWLSGKMLSLPTEH